MKESLPPLTPSDSPPPRSHRTVSNRIIAMVIGIAITFAMVTMLVAFATVYWVITQPKDSAVTPETVVAPDQTQARAAAATVGYWNSVIEVDKQVFSELAQFSDAFYPTADAQQRIKNTHIVAERFPLVANFWAVTVAALPMSNVDESLLTHVRSEMKNNQQISSGLIGMSKATTEYEQWKSSSAASSELTLPEMAEALLRGVVGNPMAAFEIEKDKKSKVSAERQKIIDSYTASQTQVIECGKQAEDLKMAELELRSRLTNKYGVEFPARPVME